MLTAGGVCGLKWFWYFVIYSFLGFLLEVLFARLVHGRPDRKCLLVLPLCPVYGLGTCAALLLAPLAKGRPAVLFLLGAAACTAVEYATAAWCERVLGVRFWNYRGLAGNLHGRVCAPFSAAWGLLILAVVYRIHPAVARLVSAIPASVTAVALPVLLVDVAVSGVMLRRTGDRACLRWYDAISRKARGGQIPAAPDNDKGPPSG